MKHKKRLALVLLLMLVVIVVSFVSTGVVIMDHAQGTEGDFDYLLVLGTAVEGTEPSGMLMDRIEAAYTYLASHPNVICIVSGYKSGTGEISEAECMYRELAERGIDPERIWIEPNASSTLENLSFTMALIREKTGSTPSRIGILSSEFHLLRAEMFAKEQGVECVAIPAKTSDAGTFISYFLREIIMVWYYSIF